MHILTQITFRYGRIEPDITEQSVLTNAVVMLAVKIVLPHQHAEARGAAVERHIWESRGLQISSDRLKLADPGSPSTAGR